MSPVYPNPVVAAKRIVVTVPLNATLACCHALPWSPLSVHWVVHVVPPSDDVSKFNVPTVAPYMWCQKVTKPAVVSTLLSRTKGPTDG